MPERLDRVAISTHSETVEIPWSSRDRLLHELRNLDGGDAIRQAFEAVGASRPVPLSDADKALLVKAIDGWASSVTLAELPEGIWTLRCAVADELDGAPDPAP